MWLDVVVIAKLIATVIQITLFVCKYSTLLMAAMDNSKGGRVGGDDTDEKYGSRDPSPSGMSSVSNQQSMYSDYAIRGYDVPESNVGRRPRISGSTQPAQSGKSGGMNRIGRGVLTQEMDKGYGSDTTVMTVQEPSVKGMLELIYLRPVLR